MKKYFCIVLALCLLVATVPMVSLSASAKPALDTTHPSYRPDDGWRTHPEDYKLLVITFDGPPDSASTTTNTQVMRMINAVYNCGGGSALLNSRASYLETHGPAQLQYALARGFEIGVYPSDPVDELDPNRDHTPQLSYYPKEDQMRLVKAAYDLIKEQTGYTPNSLRPPYLNANDDTKAVCRELGLYMTIGNASSLAPGVYYKPETAGISVENYVNCAFDGAFWISHPQVGGAAALEQALPIMYDMGFRFCTVEEIFEYRNKTPELGASYREVLRDKNPLIDVTAGTANGGTLTFGEYAVDGKTSLVNTVANQVIRVKATPDEGKILVPGSLTYTTASGKTVPIINKNMQLDKFGEGDGYSFEFVAPAEDVTINAQFADASTTSFSFDTIGTSVHQNQNGVYDGIRFLTRFNFGTFDTSKDEITVTYNGETCTVVHMGMLLKRASNTADLTLANFSNKEVNTGGANTIWNAPAYNAAGGTLAVVDYTDSYIDIQVRMMKGDTTDISTFRNRKFTARGYMVVRNAAGVETVLYSASSVTKCVNDIIPPAPLRPEFGEIELN